ncbi:class I SAM-dependent methyltransferase [Candidatus Leptofilum sp.]|uniref:class I SAM-dependent methyltransferase n=1 Tax=Candidatus Leptofilum sp. TaxID=3241576 RepID=UPI003B5BAC01
MINQQKQTIDSQSKTPTFDPIRYKDGQQAQWNQVAAGWRQWWPLFEQGAQPLSQHLVTLANLQSGQRVLDVATGVGEPALTAVATVGEKGRIIAIDQSAQMLAIAKERAGTLGYQADFLEMDAESLDLPPSSFDAILSRWGLMFLPNLDEALGEMRQLLRVGGRLATAVWDVPSKVPMLSLPMRIVREFLQLPPPPAGIPTPFNLADIATFEQRLAQAGFKEIQSECLTLTWEFASAEEFVQMTRDLAAPVTALLANHPVERQVAVWDAIGEAVEQYRAANGRIVVPSEVICVVAIR